MKWFMSYVQVYKDGRFMFGHCVRDCSEHPIETIRRWNENYGRQDGFQQVLLSFQAVDASVLEADVLSHGIS